MKREPSPYDLAIAERKRILEPRRRGQRTIRLRMKDNEHRIMRLIAHQEGVSVAELVRRAVDEYLMRKSNDLRS